MTVYLTPAIGRTGATVMRRTFEVFVENLHRFRNADGWRVVVDPVGGQ
jgi:hypothetical protein